MNSFQVYYVHSSLEGELGYHGVELKVSVVRKAAYTKKYLKLEKELG